MPTPTPKLDQEHDNLDLVSRDSIRELSEQDPLSIAIAICRANDCPALSRLENSRARLEELYKVKAGPRVKPRQLDQADNPMTNEATFNKLRDTAINDEAKFENLRDVAAALANFHAPPYELDGRPYAPLYGQSIGRWWNNPELDGRYGSRQLAQDGLASLYLNSKEDIRQALERLDRLDRNTLEDLLKFRGPFDGRYGSRQLAQDQGRASSLPSDEAIRQAFEGIGKSTLEDLLKFGGQLDGRYGSRQLAQDQGLPSFLKSNEAIRQALGRIDRNILEDLLKYQAKPKAAPEIGQARVVRAKTDGASPEIGQVAALRAKTDGASPEIGQVVAASAKTDGAAPEIGQVAAARAKTDGAIAEID